MLAIIWDWFLTNIIGKIKWEFILKMLGKRYYNLTQEDLEQFKEKLTANNYVILTRRNKHLSTYLLSLVDVLFRRKFGYWSHCALNTEGTVVDINDFKIFEAIGSGVHASTFMQVFDCDSAVLLIPKGFTPDEWDNALLDAAKQVGKPYDTIFDCMDDSKLSCIELIIHALKSADSDYSINFKSFESMLKKYGTVTPEMLYSSGDFKVELEIRR